MEPIATFSGLASGVQWRDLVDQLMQVERRPATLLERQITQIQTRSAAWLSFQNKLTTFQDAAGALADGSEFDHYSTAVSGSGFKASASDDASPGSYSVEVLGLATAEKVGGDIVASSSDALGHSGELWLNGTRIEVGAGDSLSDIAYAINGANTGVDATGVTAAVVQAGDGYQLVLTSQRTGAAGIDLAGGDGLLQSLGLTDATTAIKHATSDGAKSDGFASATTAVSTLRGLTGTPSGDVTFGTGAAAFTVNLDLTKDLDALAADINTASPGGVTAAVVTETVDGETVHRLDISGTTSFTDTDGILQTLGVLEGGRGTVAQVVTSGTALQAGGAAATGATDLTTLQIAGTGTNTQIGDTFTVAGTRADGTTFELTLEVAASADLASGRVATLGDVVDALNGADGYDGTATAAIAADGTITVTDATGRASQLGLSIVANNEGGGSLDFGTFDATTVGRAREIVDGADAAVRIDGVYSTHETNSVSGVIPGVSLTLTGTNAGSPGTVTTSRDTDAVVDAVKALVDGYNGVASFVTDQATGGEGSNRPLAGDSTLRGMKNRLQSALQTVLNTGVGGQWARLGDLGIEIQRDGTFEMDEAKLRDALASDPLAVERLFGVHGATSGSGLDYIGASDSTVSGEYTVSVTAHATTAQVVGAGSLADGSYDGPTETMTLTDLGSGKSYAIDLVTGRSATGFVADTNAVLDAAATHSIASSTAMDSDIGGTAVTEDTTWAEVHQGGVSAGAADGDAITISGRRADGTSFYETLTIDDAATQTVGELRDRVQNAVGADATVALVDGELVVTAGESGSSLLELTIGSDNAGGGSLELGTTVRTEGRPAAGITASLDATGELKLVHDDYGSAAGFRVEYSAGAATELGLGASGTEHTGTDVQGTIGGMAATGSGRVLTGAEDTAIAGLMIRVDPTFTDGSVLFSRGVASRVEQALAPMLETGAGSVQSIIDGLDERVGDMNDRIADIETRMERRREDLIRRFTAMEQAMAVAQNQSSWLASQIGALPGSYSSTGQ